MYKKILVPLDGSALAETVIPHVTELAQGQGSKIVLLSVLGEPMLSKADPHAIPTSMGSDQFYKAIEERESYLRDIVTRLTELGLEAEFIIEHGPVVSTISGVADREDVSVVVIVSHGRTGVAHTVYGSVAAGLLYQVLQPLLVIRAPLA